MIPVSSTTSDVNEICQQTRLEFINWWRNNEVGDPGYKEAAEKVRKVALEYGFPREEMTLHHHLFRFGPHLYYGEKPGQLKFIPISRADGMILADQMNDPDGPCWPIQDTDTNTYFFPKVTENRIPPPSGSCPTDQYLDRIVRRADWDRSSKEYRILEALVPYAELFHQMSKPMYQNISRIIEAYPKKDCSRAPSFW